MNDREINLILKNLQDRGDLPFTSKDIKSLEGTLRNFSLGIQEESKKINGVKLSTVSWEGDISYNLRLHYLLNNAEFTDNRTRGVLRYLCQGMPHFMAKALNELDINEVIRDSDTSLSIFGMLNTYNERKGLIFRKPILIIPGEKQEILREFENNYRFPIHTLRSLSKILGDKVHSIRDEVAYRTGLF